MSWHVTANEITRWSEANSRRAQEILPKIVRKLILATVNSKYINFPSGDSVLTGGWDGVLEVETGNEFILSGKTYWEFGTNKSINSKVKSDYKKRTDTEADSNTSYVFATTQTWRDKGKFETEKNLEAKWREVRGVNADDLETWLTLAPAVHRWFAKLIGKRPKNALDIEEAFDRWCNQTQVKLSSELVLKSREEEIQKLISALDNKPSKIIVISQSEQESFAFIISVLKDSEKYSSRVLIVSSQNEWDNLIQSAHSLILIPQNFTPSNIGQAVNNGHSVIEANENSNTSDDSNIKIELSKTRKEHKREVLEEMGVDRDKAWEVLNDTKGFLHAIVKHRFLKPLESLNPNWIEKYSIDVLSSILLINSWSSQNIYDIKILEQLSELSYENFEKELHKLEREKETPIRRVGNIWQVISKINLWDLIADKISVSQINKLHNITIDIFTEINPTFAVEAKKRWLAYDKNLNYSGLIRESLADTLCLISVFGNQKLNYPSGINSTISRWLDTLYNKNLNVETWYSYGHQLLLLAEASPNSFLSAFEKALVKEDSHLEKLFESGEDYMGSCFHCDLLWALERISWNTDYISRVVLILAKLSKLEIQSNMGNNPFNSLREIFLGWINYSSLNYNEKVQILENLLLKKVPDIAWKLLIELLPNTHSTASMINTPKYHTWDEKLSRSVSEEYNYSYEINRLILENVNSDMSKWKDIFKNIDKFNDANFFAAIENFCKLDKSLVSEVDKFELSIILRDIIHQHRKYRDANWVMKIDWIDRLEDAFHFIEPDKLILKYKYLFDEYSPHILKPHDNDDDLEEEDRQYEILKRKAVTIILKEEGFKALSELIESVQYPNHISRILVELEIENHNDEIFSWLKSDKKQFSYFAQEYIGFLYFKQKLVIDDNFLKNYSPPERAKVLLALPFESNTFEILKKQDEKIQKYYWQNNNVYFRIEDNSIGYVEWITNQLSFYKRPMRAIDFFSNILYMQKKGSVIDIDLELLYKILMQVATEENGENLNHHHLSKTVKYYLKNSDDAEKKKSLEWIFIHFNDIKPLNLEKEIIENSKFFVELISYIYKPKNSEREDEDLTQEQLRNRAQQAQKVIEKIQRVPGQNDKNAIDVEFLKNWILETKDIFKEVDRVSIGNNQVGQLLSKSPKGSDGIWPHESVREVLEESLGNTLETAFLVGKQNQRGVITRSYDEGGAQEYQLAKHYREGAEKIKFTFPRTSYLLNKLAHWYEHDGQREDISNEL